MCCEYAGTRKRREEQEEERTGAEDGPSDSQSEEERLQEQPSSVYVRSVFIISMCVDVRGSSNVQRIYFKTTYLCCCYSRGEERKAA